MPEENNAPVFRWPDATAWGLFGLVVLFFLVLKSYSLHWQTGDENVYFYKLTSGNGTPVDPPNMDPPGDPPGMDPPGSDPMAEPARIFRPCIVLERVDSRLTGAEDNALLKLADMLEGFHDLLLLEF